MGAQVAAHLVNAEVETILFELAAEGAEKNALAANAIAGLGKLAPPPLGTPQRAALITPANYEQHLDALGGCDLVIEAIAERAEWKKALYARILPHLDEQTMLCTNTSGLSINDLALGLPEPLKRRFCGLHFFNPPRYMRLVELIPIAQTSNSVLGLLENFLVSTLGKGVVYAKDTPNFIGNRIGVFSMLAAMFHAENYGIRFDTVDGLTGTLIGRPKSATYRTADVVGLDTVKHVIEAAAQLLVDDPWRRYYVVPAWLVRLVHEGALGQKTGTGVYRKQGKTIDVLDVNAGGYRPQDPESAPEITAAMAEENPSERFRLLRSMGHPQAEFLWAIHRDVFHYAVVLLETIADSARDVDLAMRWGFGWEKGPFETWQMLGWRKVADWIEQDIADGKTLADAPLPGWVRDIDMPHRPSGSWSPAGKLYRPPAKSKVYRRQLFPVTLVGYATPDRGQVMFENEAVRFWHQGDDIGVLSFLHKMHVIGSDVLDGINHALDLAQEKLAGLVIWHQQAPFSAGANLKQFLPVLKSGDPGAVEQIVDHFQKTALRLRDAPVPVVAAPHGLVLGGGCELAMHCDRIVAAFETYMGLPEVGVGLIPGGGGSKELARRAAHRAADEDPFTWLQRYFENVAMAKVSGSAQEARQLGYLRDSDIVVFNVDELLFVAKAQVRAMVEAGYRRPLQPRFKVAGKSGMANLYNVLVNYHEGGFISDHDFLIGKTLARVMCGGEVESGLEVDEAWLLRLEREALAELAQSTATHARIEHMLATGKALRN